MIARGRRGIWPSRYRGSFHTRRITLYSNEVVIAYIFLFFYLGNIKTIIDYIFKDAINLFQTRILSTFI